MQTAQTRTRSDNRRISPHDARWARRDLYAFLTLVALWALFFWRYFAPNPADLVALPKGDFSEHFYVLRSWVYDQLLAGRFPLYEFLQRVPEQVRWKLMGVKYVVTNRTSLVLANGAEAEKLAQDGEGESLQVLYRLPESPRAAWTVHQVIVVGDRKSLYEQLNRPDFDPFASAVLSKSVPIEDGDPSQDQVHLTHFEPNRIALYAHLASAGLLVLGEVTYPGWRVYVNGQGAPLYEANGILRAVVLPAGDSQVEFRFYPVSFYAGLAVSVCTLLGLVGWAFVRRARRGRGRKERSVQSNCG